MKQQKVKVNILTVIMLTLVLSLHVKGQYFPNKSKRVQIDSLINVIKETRNDTLKINLYNQIASEFSQNHTDSSLYYESKSLIISKRIKDIGRQKESLYDISNSYITIGNFKGALEATLELLQLSEKTYDTLNIFKCFDNIGLIYNNTNDFKKELEYYKKCLIILKFKSKGFSLSILHENIGDAYMNLNNFDSALIHFKIGNEIAQSNKDAVELFNSYQNMGEINLKLLNYKRALSYFHLADDILKDKESFYLVDYSDLYIKFETVFEKLNKYDSAILYATKAYCAGKEANGSLEILNSCKALSDLYRTRHKIDSAYKYQSEMIVLKDSIFSESKIRGIEIESANEIKRQTEIEELAIKEQEEKIKNIELTGIGIFIPSFYFIVMLISKRSINKKIIEFLALITLILFFDFIKLLISPYTKSFTKGNPILILVASLCIALLLGPLKRKLDKITKSVILK